MLEKNYTAKEFRAIATLKNGCYEVEADGSNVFVTVDAGDSINVKMVGAGNGSIELSGSGDGDAERTGAGYGDALRAGDGAGNAWRTGAGKGDAERTGAGYGDALRTDAGDGNAWRDDTGDGNACRTGAGYGDALRAGAGKGDALIERAIMTEQIKPKQCGEKAWYIPNQNSFDITQHVGKSLYSGDYDALIKEIHELRKEKARKQYLIDSVKFVIPFDEKKYALCEADFTQIIEDSESETADKEFFEFYESTDAAIDAAIAKSEN